jgi:chromosome segregation ATPase
MEEERSEILELQRQLYAMCEVLDQRYYQTFQIEEAEAAKTENLETFTERFNALMQALETRANDAGVALAETKNTVEALETKLAEIQSELDILKAEKAQAELEAKTAKRESALAEIGIELNDTNKDRFLEFSDSDFEFFVESLKTVRNSVGGKSTAETKIKLPDPVSNTEITNDVIKESHKAATQKGVK